MLKKEEENHLATMLLVVADAANFSSQQLTKAEKATKAATWSRILFKIIPEDRLLDALDRAIADHKTSFAVNGYDLKLAYERIVAEEKAEEAAAKAEAEKLEREDREKNPVKYCADRHLHVTAFGDAEVCNPLNFAETIVLPCGTCRPNAYAERRSDFIANNKGSELNLLAELNKTVKKKEKISEVYLSLDEAEKLFTEHNNLVREIVEDAEARRQLELVFDEGANRFKLPHRADMLYTEKDVREKIERYTKIVEKNGK